ncbi:MAG TPA: gliding motility-associated C-terminal domain-containing protein, partial [Phaeodactylibacter sp.]|nr:gliding motility-associated C-terminal domain-containing protein [Phaeodactylibacter sp.]
GSYAVEAEVFGCPFHENFELSLSDCRSRIYLPTAFSPNGDGLNDQFLPQGKDYEGIELQVYDRWGGLLYSIREVPFAWDGGDAPTGVYTWLFRYLNTLSGEEEVLSGEVNLVR